MAKTFAAVAVALASILCSPARTEAHPSLTFCALVVAIGGAALTNRQTGRRAKRERAGAKTLAAPSLPSSEVQEFARYP